MPVVRLPTVARRHGEHRAHLVHGACRTGESARRRAQQDAARRRGAELAVPRAAAGDTNQVLDTLRGRGIESALLPWCRAGGVPMQAYSAIENGRLVNGRALSAVAARHGAKPAQIALAWVLRHSDMMVIPKA